MAKRETCSVSFRYSIKILGNCLGFSFFAVVRGRDRDVYLWADSLSRLLLILPWHRRQNAGFLSRASGVWVMAAVYCTLMNYRSLATIN